jgi:hypothetical protein
LNDETNLESEHEGKMKNRSYKEILAKLRAQKKIPFDKVLDPNKATRFRRASSDIYIGEARAKMSDQVSRENFRRSNDASRVSKA